jgi:hypothetical protein
LNALDTETHLVAGSHAIEHGRFLHLECHSHARHVEVGQRAVPDRELAGDLIYLLNFALGQRREIAGTASTKNCRRSILKSDILNGSRVSREP